MSNSSDRHSELFDLIHSKSILKQQVYHTTLTALRSIVQAAHQFSHSFNAFLNNNKLSPVIFQTITRGDFELEVKFGGDVLIFLMHTNIFEMPRHHMVMQTPYVKEDSTRSYCGIINIYNFLADSFKYNRTNDIGYLIGRIFINKDNHYFIEGKQELGFLYHTFGQSVMSQERADEIVESAIRYTINFDLLTPPYEQVQEITLNEIKNTLDSISLKTGKRLGFRFNADKVTME